MKKAILLPASFVLAALACSIVCGCAVGERASIAGSLLEIRDNETRKNAAMAQETRDFDRAKHFFLETNKAQGTALTRDDCRRFFGEPSSEFSGRWGYKPATSDWFKGERLFLFFDAQGVLSRWEYLPS
jgi:hypothetical protein